MAAAALLFQVLFEATVKGVPQRVLGSASYQVGKMDVLNVSDSSSAHPGLESRLMTLFIWVFQGTPALFLVLLLCQSSMVGAYVEDERCVLQGGRSF